MKRIKNKMNLRSTAGFSLVELVVVLAVGAILVVTAVPNLSDYVDNQRIIAVSNDIIAQVNRARSEAMKRNEMVVMCSANVLDESPLNRPCVNRVWWHYGSLMFVQERGDDDFGLPAKKTWNKADPNMEMIQVTDRNTNKLFRIRTSPLAKFGIGFAPDGSVIAFDAAGAHIDDVNMLGEGMQFAVCDGRGNSHGRVVQISHTGRARIVKTDDPNISANCVGT